MGKTKTSNTDTEIAELVNEYVHNLDDKGKLQLPEDMPSWQKHIIRGEKRTRDAQAELSLEQNKFRQSEAKNAVLMETASTMVPEDFQLSDTELTELNTLKKNDPDAYRLKVNALEASALEAQQTKLTEMTTKAAEEATAAHTTKNRVTVLAEFRDANPDLSITDDVLVNDVPPRLLAGVTSGQYSYGEYLTKVKEYLTTGKTTTGDETGDPHNMHKLPGGQTPGKKAAEKAGQSDYAKMTF